MPSSTTIWCAHSSRVTCEVPIAPDEQVLQLDPLNVEAHNSKGVCCKQVSAGVLLSASVRVRPR